MSTSTITTVGGAAANASLAAPAPGVTCTSKPSVLRKYSSNSAAYR
jgi:hypothetical protein